jgi:hypothetical protein
MYSDEQHCCKGIGVPEIHILVFGGSCDREVKARRNCRCKTMLQSSSPRTAHSRRNRCISIFLSVHRGR